ncbi:flagellar basal body-associated FliL family protein [Methylomarinum sp. Ch1-1]|uniref:Flagellar protein FliL n=1 Tax=Methylomarinum roseum TaxID=3067653 RepID=A0AAU7NU96_9GAMM|nr:flagellar basal body-associated FliL family protein [Methylomarinum sp. Ch1-1]MDP4519362.1 flagellar basal body-associated FliL family protein [Methylomarinum sp. Ch1-1]
MLLLIIAGGVAVFFIKDKSVLKGDGSEALGQQAHADENAEATAQEFIYYELEQPLRVNFPKGSSANLIEIRVAFLVDHEEAEEALEKHEPMIINNLLMTISAAGADKLKLTEGKNELRAKILEETGKVMKKMTGKNAVKEIFFTAFVMQ